MDAGEEHGVAQAGAGDLVAVGVRDPFDQAMLTQPPQIVGGLAGGDDARRRPRCAASSSRRSLLRKPFGCSRNTSRTCSSAWARGSVKRRPAVRVPSSWMTGSQVACRTSAPVMGSWLSRGAQQAPVGGVADLPQSGQIGQPFAEAEVHGVVDGRFSAERPALLVVLLDLRALVEDVQARGDTVGDDASGEGAGGVVLAATVDAAVKDQADPVGAARGRGCRG